MAKYTDCVALMEPAELGSAKVTVDEPSDVERLRGTLHGMPLNRERYVRLTVGGETVMTDAEFERWTNAHFVENASGDCLIAGLGIGLILEPALKQCDAVTVVEINPDVIALVAPKFPKVNVVQADIRTYKPTRLYDTIYLDIWSIFNEDTSREAGVLKRRLKKHLITGGWIGDWSTEAMKFRRRR